MARNSLLGSAARLNAHRGPHSDTRGAVVKRKKMFSSRKNRILLAIATIAAAGVYAVGGSFAFLHDTEASIENTFTSGAVDLTVDATSTFNDLVCRDNGEEFVWLEAEGLTPPDPLPSYYGQPCQTAWELVDLNPSHKLFDSANLKPGDHGTTVASLHIKNNDGYACLLTTDFADDDPTLTDPEKKVDSTQGPGNGELGNAMQMFLWFDDGDGVWQTGETKIDDPQDPSSAQQFLDNRAINLFTSDTGPLTASTTAYIGFAWCVGDLQVANGNFGCTVGSEMNEIQDDEISSSFAFMVEQARHNEEFFCDPPPPPPPPPDNECEWQGECISVELIEVAIINGKSDDNNDIQKNEESQPLTLGQTSFNNNNNNHNNDDKDEKDDKDYHHHDKDEGTIVYRYKITNTCKRALSYVAFELPYGAEALSPKDNAVYHGPNGINYKVENTTNNPFYSIKFETIGEGIKNGAMDEFEFTMPLSDPLESPEKIKAKFGNQTEKIKAKLDMCPLTDRIPPPKDHKHDDDKDGHDKKDDKDGHNDYWDWYWDWNGKEHNKNF